MQRRAFYMHRRTRLAAARKALKLTQRGLAARLGVSRLAVVNVEVGRRTPSLQFMLAWVAALGKHGALDLFNPELDPAPAENPSEPAVEAA